MVSWLLFPPLTLSGTDPTNACKLAIQFTSLTFGRTAFQWINWQFIYILLSQLRLNWICSQTDRQIGKPLRVFTSVKRICRIVTGNVCKQLLLIVRLSHLLEMRWTIFATLGSCPETNFDWGFESKLGGPMACVFFKQASGSVSSGTYNA